MHEFRYSLKPLMTEAIGVILGAGIIVATNRATNLLVVGIIVAGIAAYRVILSAASMCTVILHEESILIRYFLPLRKPREIRYVDVGSYGAARLPKRPHVIFGILTPKIGKPVMLWSRSIERFEELNRILEGLFAKKEPNKAPEPTPTAVTPRADV
jgi:hypothetical protein